MTATPSATRTEARQVFNDTFDSFAMTATDLAKSTGLSRQRVSSLLKTLEAKGLVVSSHVNGESTLTWQTSQTTDQIDGTQAAAWFDETWPAEDGDAPAPVQPEAPAPTEHFETSKPARAPKATNPTDCGCGCGTPTKSAYAPGHDARHAGQVARDAVALGGSIVDRNRYIEGALLSHPLRVKASNMADRLLQAQAAKVQREQAKVDARLEREAAKQAAAAAKELAGTKAAELVSA